MLREAGYSAGPVRIGSRDALVFESDTVLGFVCVYDSSAKLMESWSKDSDQAISTYQFGLRRSGTKAWNTYLILRSEEHTSELQSLMRISYAVFCLKTQTNIKHKQNKRDN